MRRQDFSYTLPEELIAKQPPAERGDSRLLHLNGVTGALDDQNFADLLAHVHAGDLMVFNDTRVIPARVFGQKATGGQVEIMVERIVDRHRVMAQIRASKAPRPQSVISLDDGTELLVQTRHNDLYELVFPRDRTALEVLESVGHMPLPPYIDRADQPSDRERYQTVYGQRLGAVAAPTAGLHFDQALMDALRNKGVGIAFVTLHVGAGTFQPMRADRVQDHVMHSEVMELTAEVAEQVRQTRASGGRVIAVGTTSVRCLETAAQTGELGAYQGETNIFIYPNYRFRVVDCLITNFHLPESTLIMLVSAFAGYRLTMAAYRHAVDKKYRFFSYGDAMFIERNPRAHEDLPLSSSEA